MTELEKALAQIERVFPNQNHATREQWSALGFKSNCDVWTKADEIEAEHIRAESHSSRFI